MARIVALVMGLCMAFAPPVPLDCTTGCLAVQEDSVELLPTAFDVTFPSIESGSCTACQHCSGCNRISCIADGKLILEAMSSTDIRCRKNDDPGWITIELGDPYTITYNEEPLPCDGPDEYKDWSYSYLGMWYYTSGSVKFGCTFCPLHVIE